MKIVIIGSGNVAEALAVALAEGGMPAEQVWARNKVRGREVARLGDSRWCGEAAGLAEADLYLISVSDRAIAEVAAALPFPKGAIVAHTAGCGTLEMLPEGVSRAVIYPFQTFSSGRRVDFRRVYMFVEAEDEQTLARAKEFAATLSENVCEASAEVRKHIHLCGVFGSNFVNSMYACAAKVLSEVGLPFDVVAPVVAETAAKALASGSPADVQTGPAARGDIGTMERHRALIGEDALLREIYDKISENIWRTKQEKISKR